MLSGVKFISRDQISEADSEKRKRSGDRGKKSSDRKEKNRRTSKSSKSYSSSDDDIGRVKKGSQKKKKWYSSDEYSSVDSSENESEGSFDQREKKERNRRKNKRRKHYNSGDEVSDRSKRRPRRSKKHYSSEEYSSDDSEDGCGEDSGKRGKKKSKERGGKDEGDGTGSHLSENIEIKRKEMGLDWMLRPAFKTDTRPTMSADNQPEEPEADDMIKVNPRELNPYLKNNGSGYPDDAEEQRVGGDKLPSSSVVGDGGASWRLKALKRAQEQASREGRKLDEVVEERWGFLGQLTVSAVSHTAAPARAHLHAIKTRKREQTGEHETDTDGQSDRDVKKEEADNLKGKQVSGENPSRPQSLGRINRHLVHDITARIKDDDADRHLAQKIMQNKQYSLSGRADDEYDFGDGPSKKSRKKGVGNDHKSAETNILANCILTQQERCLFLL